MSAALILGVFICLFPAGGHAAGPDFPPVSELLTPTADLPREELRDSVAELPSLESFQEAVRSREPRLRRDAVVAMGRPGNAAAIPYLSAVLLRLDEAPAVRVAAAEALGHIGDRRAWKFLAEAVEDMDEKVRFAATLALGRVDADANVARLEQILRKDPSWWVRYAAAMAMGGTRKAFTASWLERAACEDSTWQVRFQAVLALGELGTPRAAEALGRVLSDPEGSVRSAAAMSLGRIGGAQSAFILGRALVYEQDSGVRSILHLALRKVQGA
ncbi:MAG: HEAT repeat domain-containing protein [Elusimicrobiota bacterium]|jgi:HEAT repeat protein